MQYSDGVQSKVFGDDYNGATAWSLFVEATFAARMDPESVFRSDIPPPDSGPGR